MNAGSLDVLNVGAGHIRISFIKDDPIEVERAKRMIEDMLQRGYSLFIDPGDGKLKKVHGFRASTCEYIVGTDARYAGDFQAEVEDADKTKKKKGRGRKTSKVRMQDAKVHAIAPTAGG